MKTKKWWHWRCHAGEPRPPPRPASSPFNQCVFTCSGLNESPLSTLHGNQIGALPHTHTHLSNPPPPCQRLYYCVGMLWVVQPECGCACKGDKLCVCPFIPLSHRYGSIEAEPCALAVQSMLFPEKEGTQLMSCYSRTCCVLPSGTGTLCEFLWLTFLKLNF